MSSIDLSDLPFDTLTEELAKLNGVRPASIRAHLSRHGSYFGIIPRKLAGGRLMWPRVQMTATGPVPVPRPDR